MHAGEVALLTVCCSGQVRRKQTASGVDLGDDVLTLVVEPHIDQSLIMGMVVVHGLMNYSM